MDHIGRVLVPTATVPHHLTPLVGQFLL